MSAHTPGPWRGKTVIAMTVVLEECGVSLGFGSRRTEETVANARLIAAAPELLEALEALVAEVSGNAARGNPASAYWGSVTAAQNVINKVREP